eukprot:tig00000042_g15494.t1
MSPQERAAAQQEARKIMAMRSGPDSDGDDGDENEALFQRRVVAAGGAAAAVGVDLRRLGICDCGCGAADPGPRSAPAAGAGALRRPAGGLGGAGGLGAFKVVNALPGRLEGPDLPEGAAATAVDCSSLGRRFLFTYSAPALTVEGLTVTGGAPLSPNEASLPNDGKYCWDGALMIYATSSNSTALVSACRFLGNRAVGGGAIAVYGAVPAKIADSLFYNNTGSAHGSRPLPGPAAPRADGARVGAAGPEAVYATTTTSTIQAVPQGGALLLCSPAAVTIRGFYVEGNTVQGNSTGKFGYASTTTSLTTSRCNITANFAGPPASAPRPVAPWTAGRAVAGPADAAGYGGALYLGNAKLVAISGSVFAGNRTVPGASATTASGSALYASTATSLALSDSSFSYNAVAAGATADGAGTGHDAALVVVDASAATVSGTVFRRNRGPPRPPSPASPAPHGRPHSLRRLRGRGGRGGAGPARLLQMQASSFTGNTTAVYAGPRPSEPELCASSDPAPAPARGRPSTPRRCTIARNSAASAPRRAPRGGGAVSAQTGGVLDLVESDISETSGGVPRRFRPAPAPPPRPFAYVSSGDAGRARRVSMGNSTAVIQYAPPRHLSP